MYTEQMSKQWSLIVAKAWADDQFKKKLLANPATVLRENGVNLPAGITVNVVESTDKVLNLTLPAKPSGELAEEDLERVAGGRAYCITENIPSGRV